MKKAYFEIRVLDNPPQHYLVRGETEEECVQALHTYLRSTQPNVWSHDWRDLLDDVHEGNQTMYGPAEIVNL